MSDTVFKVFSSCFLVSGISRSLIIDSQRWKYFTIPNTLYEILKVYDGYPISNVKQKVAKTESELRILDEYFDFLFENELIFECNKQTANNFVPLKTEFDNPSKITNSILEFSDTNTIRLKGILTELTQLGCYNIEIRLINPVECFDLVDFFETCKEFEIENLSVLVQTMASPEQLDGIIINYPFIAKLINYNQDLEFKLPSGIVFTKRDLSKNNCCGVIREEYFTPTMKHFLESVNYNTCLNRKIAIDTDGYIKNCPSMKESYGNINLTPIQDVVNVLEFKKHWNIGKDDISKCKDCEYRHICTDCRAYVDDPEDIYSAPLKCGYNPYTCEWDEWSTHPLKQQAISHYNMHKIV